MTTYIGPVGGLVWPDPVTVCVDVVSVPEPKTTTKNRVHLDLATTSATHQAELVARLQALCATPAHAGQGEEPWTVLADPESNEFCVLEPQEVYRDTGPIAAVVVDCADPRAMARFWGEAVDWTLHEVTDDHAVLRSAKDVGPYLEFLRTLGVKTVPDRVHLDLLPYPDDDKAAEVARLRALGATTSTSARATSRGHAWLTRRATSSASSLPTPDPGWSQEISLDVDMVSATCPASASWSSKPTPPPTRTWQSRSAPPSAWGDGGVQQLRRPRITPASWTWPASTTTRAPRSWPRPATPASSTKPISRPPSAASSPSAAPH